ncbi:VTT domain-containing protein [Bdellovibrionota bacterium FG-1]
MGLIKSALTSLTNFASHRWYLPLVALLSGIDAFVFFIPNEALLIPAVMARPKNWLRVAAWVSLGSALGATLFSQLCGSFGPRVIEFFAPHLTESENWRKAITLVHQYGLPGVTLASLSPAPQHAAVAIAGLAHLSWAGIFCAVFIGRFIKYGVIAWLTVSAPKAVKSARR